MQGDNIESNAAAEESQNSLAPEECPYIALLGTVTEKGYLLEGDRDAIWKKLKLRSENKQCFDCHTRNPTWMSSSFGILLCMVCSGKHRNLGSSISFVRSIDLDNIRPEELLKVEVGGNARARIAFKSLGWNEAKEMDYRGKIAEKYKSNLDTEVKSIITKFRPSLTRSPSPARAPAPLEKIATVSNPSFSQSTAAAAPVMSGPLSSALGHLKSQKAQPITRAPPIAKAPLITASVMAKQAPSTSSHFTTTTSPTLKPQLAAQTGGFEFDFEEAFAESATASTVAPTSHIQDDIPASVDVFRGQNIESESSNFAATRDTLQPPRSDGPSSSRFANAASISSDDYFNRTSRNDADPNRLNKFSDAKSISSAAYFGNSDTNQASSSVLDDETTARLAIYSQQAMEKVTTIGQNATEMVNKAAEWFSQISRT